MQQELERQVNRQRSSSALKRTARHLVDVAELMSALHSVWTYCHTFCTEHTSLFDPIMTDMNLAVLCFWGCCSCHNHVAV
mgnify:CR=1 FL=1